MNQLERTITPRGKPRLFPTDEEFYEAVAEYLKACDTEFRCLPTYAGFCTYYKIHRGTFYDQEKHYPDTYKKVREMFEASVLASKWASDTMKIFYLKNHFNYRDRSEQQITTNQTPVKEADLSVLSNDELQMLKTILSKTKVKVEK